MVEYGVSQFTLREIKEKFRLAENSLSARCSRTLFFKVLAVHKTNNLFTASARENKRTARMLANARKYHLIPLIKRNHALQLFACFFLL